MLCCCSWVKIWRNGSSPSGFLLRKHGQGMFFFLYPPASSVQPQLLLLHVKAVHVRPCLKTTVYEVRLLWTLNIETKSTFLFLSQQHANGNNHPAEDPIATSSLQNTRFVAVFVVVCVVVVGFREEEGEGGKGEGGCGSCSQRRSRDSSTCPASMLFTASNHFFLFPDFTSLED